MWNRELCVVCTNRCGRTVADPPYMIVVHEPDGWRPMLHPDEDDRTDLMCAYAHVNCWENVGV